MTLKKLKTAYVMRNLLLYVPNKASDQSDVLKDEEIFQYHKKKILLVRE